MAKQTTLTCDRCGESWDSTDRKQLWRISVGRRDDSYPTRGFDEAPHLRAEWCRKCCVETGVLLS